MTRTLPRAESTFDAIERITQAGLPAQQLLEEVARRLDRVVPSDGYFIGATDPDTTLCMGSGVVHELPYEMCAPTWDYEFLVPDYLKFVEIAASGRPVADLHEATGGRPERSARWRELGTTNGLGSEVRVVFTVGDSTWGVAQLNRANDSARYSNEEKAWLERVAPVVATGLRQAMVVEPSTSPCDRGPGIVVLDPDGRPLSATREAAAWLDELDLTGAAMSAFPLPFEAHAYASRVRASSSAEGDGVRIPRARLRTRAGVWLVMHGSMLEGTDDVALVIEPAKANDIAPLIVEAYGLTQREVDVTRAISRGLGTAEIATHLFVSQHTVRDHVKSVFEKVGVSCRGELVAKVFADHYSPVLTHIDY